MFLVLALAAQAGAVELRGSVVSIQDGDTLTVLINHQSVKVRLIDIDAPEAKQPFGQQSKQFLSMLCVGKPIRIDTTSKDRYGRSLARVTCGNTDVNAEMVSRGMAWVYDEYVKDRTLYQLQDEARSSDRGLWTDSKSIAPWEWRKLGKGAREKYRL